MIRIKEIARTRELSGSALQAITAMPLTRT